MREQVQLERRRQFQHTLRRRIPTSDVREGGEMKREGRERAREIWLREGRGRERRDGKGRGEGGREREREEGRERGRKGERGREREGEERKKGKEASSQVIM